MYTILSVNVIDEIDSKEAFKNVRSTNLERPVIEIEKMMSFVGLKISTKAIEKALNREETFFLAKLEVA